jgi:epidermal growth factor receptor substrate 15
LLLSGHPNLNLSGEEKRVYDQLLKEADPDGFGAVSGDIAVKFFERTKLPPDVLGQVSTYSDGAVAPQLMCTQIWQIADMDNRGFLGPAGFGVVLRLIGHAQNGHAPTAQLATQGMSSSM